MTHSAHVIPTPAAAVSTDAIEINLQADLEEAKTLASLLDEENQILRSNTESINAQLSRVTEAKQTHIETLERNAIEREQWVSPAVNPANGEQKQAQQQMAAWQQLLAQSDNLGTLWQKVEQYIEICQRLNMINGRLIGFRKQRGQRLAEILFGRPQTNTYGANGYSESSRGSHSLVHA